MGSEATDTSNRGDGRESLRLAIDVSPAAKSDPTGIGRYAIEFVRALAPLLRLEERISLVVRPGRWPERRFVLPLAEIPRVAPPSLLLGAFPLLFGRQTLFHSTGVALPVGLRGLAVATIPDTNTMDAPELAGARWVKERSEKTREVIARADMVLAFSSFVRERILHHFPELPPERVRVTPLGFDHAGLEREAPLRPASGPGDAAVRARYGLAGRPYVLTVGRVERRKNPEGLVRGFALSRLARGHLLVFAGQSGDSDIGQALRETGMEARVRLLGRVPDADLGALYRGAEAFAFPSHYEGFGIPLLEALACGTPSLSSDRTSIPEVAGDAAVLVDPEDAGAIAAGLDRLLGDEGLRRDLRERGPRQASRFTWRATAGATLEAYCALTALGRRR